ncbi:MAG: dTDP-glucose 4,6-dehydratase [bacterium]|nr:dTDP-glucose 4,6-dehydratase [bacterium]
MAKKTILVTGGAGFMGSNFVRYLLNKYPDYKIIVLDALTYAGNMENLPEVNLDNSRFSFWYGNVRNGELVDTLVSQSDIVFHFAAETHVTRSIYDNLLFFETDVLGTQVVANAVLKYSDRIERFVHISTSEVYGTARAEFMDEEQPLMPMSPYAAAKAGADRLVYSYWATYQIPAIIIRPFNNYGPNQHLEKAVPRFITSCLLDEPLTVHGDGKAKRDWLYVEDLCGALDLALHADIDKIKGEVINIGTGRSIDIRSIAEIVAEKMNKPKSLITYIGDRPGQVFRHTSSTDKAEKLLGWKAKTKFENGLDKTIEWYKNNRNWWEKQLWMRTIPITTAKGEKEMH